MELAEVLGRPFVAVINYDSLVARSLRSLG